MKIFFLILILILPFSLSKAEVISLDAYLTSVKQRDLFLRSIINRKDQLIFNKKIKAPDSSWILSITDQYGISSEDTSDTRRFSGELSKELITTGTELVLSYDDNKLDDREEQVKSVRIEQSLLKNSFGSQNRLELKKLSEEDRRIQIQLVEDYEDYIAERINNYLDYLESYEDLRLARKQHKESQALYKEIVERKRTSIARQVDVDRSLAEVLDFKNSLIEAEMNYNSFEIKLFEGLEISNLAKVSRIDVPYYSERIGNDKNSKEIAKGTRLVSLKKSEIMTSQFSQDIAVNNLWPDLNFFVGLSEDNSSRFGTAVNRRETFFGFSFEYQFDNSIGEGHRLQADYYKRKNELELLAIKDQISKRIEKHIGRVGFQKQRLEIFRKQVEVLSRLYSQERKRFLRGRADLETLIEVQNRLSRAQNNWVSQKVQVAKAVVEYKSLTDTLIDKL